MFRERTQHSVTFAELQNCGLSTDPSAYSTAEAALPALKISSGDRDIVAAVPKRSLGRGALRDPSVAFDFSRAPLISFRANLYIALSPPGGGLLLQKKTHLPFSFFSVLTIYHCATIAPSCSLTEQYFLIIFLWKTRAFPRRFHPPCSNSSTPA